MALNKRSINILFDISKKFDKQFSELAESCYNEVNRALNEILLAHIRNREAYVIPYGVYAVRSNYQLVEPMEFFIVLPSDRQSVEKIESVQKKKMQKGKKKLSIKEVYQSIAVSTTYDEDGSTNNLTAFDTAKTIMTHLQSYINQDDKVYYKRNIVFMKLHIDDDIDLPVIIYVGYEFENDEDETIDPRIEFSRLGYKSKENVKQSNISILEKNKATEGKYLVLCKLFKMLELELVLTDESNVYLSKKSIFVESILYNVPDQFFEGDDFSEIFTNIVNYLKQCDSKQMKMIDGSDEPLFSKNGYYSNHYYSSFVKKIVYINENGNEMIDNALEFANKLNENSQNSEKTKNETQKIKKSKK